MEKPSRTSFAEAADRLDRYLAEVKARQYDATGAKPLPPPAPVRPGQHPDAAWQQAYAARSIRPLRRGESGPPLPGYAVPPPPERPEFPDRLPSTEPADGHIGAALGKAGKKRGLLVRLLRGRGA